MSALVLVGVLVVLLLVRVPLFVVIGVATVVGYVVAGESASFQTVPLIERIRELTDKPPLLAIPFFVLSGTIMSRGAIAKRLVAVAREVFSFVPGGLGVATVAACMFFAAISGSSPVTVITIGSVMYPALIAAGFPKRFSTGLVTSAGTLGILIPPSIPMIVYAIFASGTQVIQVEDLFLAGVGPGFLIGGLLALYCLMTGKLRGERLRAPSVRAVGRAVGEGFWALMLPVVILGGIYSGIFTATEAAAVSVVYSLAVELFVHRELAVADLRSVCGEAATLMGSLLVIFAMAVGLNGLLSDLEIPNAAAEYVAGLDLTPFTFLLVLNGLLLLVGCFMDIMSAIMILVPLLAPMATRMGIDPIHLGIVFIVNLEIGYLTPPMGLNLFVSSQIFQQSLGAVVRAVLPFTLLLLIALAIVTYVPSVALGPVNLLRGRDVWVAFPDASAGPAEPGGAEGEEDRPKSLEQMMDAYRSSLDEDDFWGDEESGDEPADATPDPTETEERPDEEP